MFPSPHLNGRAQAFTDLRERNVLGRQENYAEISPYQLTTVNTDAMDAVDNAKITGVLAVVFVVCAVTSLIFLGSFSLYHIAINRIRKKQYFRVQVMIRMRVSFGSGQGTG